MFSKTLAPISLLSGGVRTEPNIYLSIYYLSIYLSIFYYILKVYETSYKRSQAATWDSYKRL